MKQRLVEGWRLRAVAFAFASGLTSFAARSAADNPIVQSIYTADPAPLVHDGRVYCYTGHDEDGATYYTMNDWRVYSSADMVNWTDHGSPLSYETFAWSSGDAWAAQAVERDGKFYWYVTLTSASNGAPAIGVAVADSPTGPFEDALGKPLVGPQWGYIDPTVFIDEDGQAYLYWGNPGLWYVKLNADMISYQGGVVQVPLTTAAFGTRQGNAERPTLYEEGPWFYRRGSTYYLVYAAGGIPEYIAYSTSSSPTGPWTYRGVIMPTEGGSFTNHPGVIDFAGSSYFFYHNGALPGGGGFARSVSVEKFAYDAEGRFPTITMSEEGPPPVANLNPFVRTEAETMAFSSGIETEPSSEGGLNVGSIEAGDFVKLRAVDFGNGAHTFEARVASANEGGSIELRLDSADGTLVGTCQVPTTGDWQTWATVSCDVTGASGVHDLYLVFTGGSGYLFNVDYWQFTGNSVEPGAGGSGGQPGTGGSAGASGAATGGASSAGTSAGGTTGGAQASGGSAAAGAGGSAVSGAGGVAAGAGGAGFAGAGGAAAGDESSDEGCGCRQAGRASGSAWSGGAALLLLALRAARRRKT